MVKWLLSLFLIFALSIIDPSLVSAHAFGTLYNLPVPFWLYMYGGAATIVVSFLIIAYFFKRTNQTFSYPSKDLSGVAFINFLTGRLFLKILKVTGLLLFFLAVISGFVGVDNPRLNVNMTLFWVIFVLGFTYSVAILGNVWTIVNPWKTIVEGIEALVGKKMEGFLVYPKALSFYPALVFYFLFIWIELFGQTTPRSLSLVLAIYSVTTLFGIVVFGKSAWLKHAEFFSVFFGLIAKISPFEYRGKKVYLRPPFVGLLIGKAEHFSLLLFILFMLSSTAFDGFRSTIQWIILLRGLLVPPADFVFGNNTFLPSQIAGVVGLPLTLFIFLYVYLLLLALAKAIAKSKLSLGELALRFAYSLVPIAFVYNVAHYYTLMLTEGQNMIRLTSDPFGYGWNLFSTAAYKTNYSVFDANFVWHFQVAVILIGHIAGVYLAHVIALGVFPSRKRAFVSQLPLLVLMIVYTMAGFWILAQPIASGM
jgi:hypothetical protein